MSAEKLTSDDLPTYQIRRVDEVRMLDILVEMQLSIWLETENANAWLLTEISQLLHLCFREAHLGSEVVLLTKGKSVVYVSFLVQLFSSICAVKRSLCYNFLVHDWVVFVFSFHGLDSDR
jgi:hypothetical protein